MPLMVDSTCIKKIVSFRKSPYSENVLGMDFFALYGYGLGQSPKEYEKKKIKFGVLKN